jgi:hypothetical protein
LTIQPQDEIERKISRAAACAMIASVTDNIGDQVGGEAWNDMLERLPRVSFPERKRIIDDYLAEIFRDVPPELQARMRRSLPDLPENADLEQVNDWLGVARSFNSSDFREIARKLAPIFDSEAELLRERAEALVAQGSISIVRNAAVVRATFKAPGRWRPGAIHAWIERADGSVSSRSVMPLSGPMDAVSIISEVALQLAIARASLDE